MKNNINEIMQKYTAGEKTLEEINAELNAAGATFHLSSLEGNGGWTEQEIKEGFIPAGTEPADVEHMYDYFSYNPANAGQTIRVTAPEGTYDVSWGEDGHPVKAVRVNP